MALQSLHSLCAEQIVHSFSCVQRLVPVTHCHWKSAAVKQTSHLSWHFTYVIQRLENSHHVPCLLAHWEKIYVIWWRFKILISFCRKRILHVLRLPKIKVYFVSNTYFDAVVCCCRCGFGTIGRRTCMWIFPIWNWRDYFINAIDAFSTLRSLVDINFGCTLHIHDNFV